MVDELDKLIGHPWVFRVSFITTGTTRVVEGSLFSCVWCVGQVEIQGAYGLPTPSSSAYVQVG